MLSTMTSLEWGSVPQWFSTLLTGGSLILGFYILLRDRKKAEQEDARKIICWVTLESEGDRFLTHVINTSDRTVHGVTLLSWTRTTPRQRRMNFTTIPVLDTLLPGEEGTKDTIRYEGEQSQISHIPWAVSFVDSDGAAWIRDLTTGHLMESHVFRHFSPVASPGLRGRRRWLHLRKTKRLAHGRW